MKNFSIIENCLSNKFVKEKIVTTKKKAKKYLPKYSRFIKLFFQKYAHKYDPK
jgi:ribosomal protein L17